MSKTITMEPLKIIFASIALMISLCMMPQTSVAEENFPVPTGAVNDFAGVITAEYRQKMEQLSREVLEKTGTALVVATITTIGNNEINEYVNRLYSAWGIGKKGEDKGVLIVLALKERKVRIETGYGVEGILPDGLVGEIRDRSIIPWLKAGDYGKGLAEGMSAIAGIVAKNANVTLMGQPANIQPRPRQVRSGSHWIFWLMVLLILAPLLGTRQGRDMLPWILLGFFSGGGGRGSGSGGFGDFGGGGFGGFGGGSSGGGGAGGRDVGRMILWRRYPINPKRFFLKSQMTSRAFLEVN